MRFETFLSILLFIVILGLYCQKNMHKERELSDWDYKVAERLIKLESRVFQLERKEQIRRGAGRINDAKEGQK